MWNLAFVKKKLYNDIGITGGAVPLRVLVKTAITVNVTPPVDFNSFLPTRHTRLPQ